MASGGGPEEERGHRGRNSELRRSISDMNLSLRRRQGINSANDPRRTSKVPNNEQDRKNIVSMIANEPGEVNLKTMHAFIHLADALIQVLECASMS